MPHFCLFGDVVNVTSRLETTSTPGMIQVGKNVVDAVRGNSKFVFERRGLVDMKGKGLCETFWYLGTSTTPLRLSHQLPLVSIAAAQEMLEFDFDVTTVPTDDASIVQATFQIFAGLLDLNQINVSPTTLKCFIRNLGFRYNNPHYHNFHHAFQVCQFTAALYHKCFLQKAREGGGETGTQFLRAIFASLISAISHDVGHDGFTNAFHVKTKSKLAHTFYNNSPMENHHIFTTMHVLGTNGCNGESSASLTLPATHLSFPNLTLTLTLTLASSAESV